MKKFILYFLLIVYFLSAKMPAAFAKEAGDTLPPTLERVDPELVPAFLENLPLALEKTGYGSWREYFAALVNSPTLPTDPAVKVYDLNILKQGTEAESLRLRIYQPLEKNDSLAGIYWIHGGGFLFGVPEQDEAQSIRFAKEVGAVVVAVDYSLAPEHPYPAALNDCYAGLLWFSENAARLGVDKQRIAVAGASAGGGLTAAVALLARDKGGPGLAFQMPLYPMLDDRFSTPASKEEFDQRVWHKEANAYAWQAYLGDRSGTKKIDYYFAPARAQNLTGLPPTYTCVGNLDPFRDDTINYAARLIQAGVPVELHIYPGAYHAFEVIAPDTAYAKRAVDEYIFVLRKSLAEP